MIESVINGQHDGGALLGGKFQQGGLHLLARSVFRRRIFSVRVLVGNFLGAVRVEMKTPRFALTPVQADVDGDAVKPGGKFRRAANRTDLLVGADKRLLR